MHLLNLWTLFALGCKTRTGVVPVGTQFQKSDCETCTCVWDSRLRKVREICAVASCAHPPCTYPVKVKGQCCPVCPRGQSKLIRYCVVNIVLIKFCITICISV